MPVPRTIADGQALTTPGALTFEVNRLLADAVETVTDDEIRTAMVFAFERLKTVLEPSGATGLAALLAKRLGPLPPRVGVILSGGTCRWSGSRSCAPAEAARTPEARAGSYGAGLGRGRGRGSAPGLRAAR